MLLFNLMSSSSGNSTIIKSGDVEIMIDAGSSLKKIAEKYEKALGKQLTKLNAILISHKHGDHISGAGVVARSVSCPIYLPEETFKQKEALFKDCEINYINGSDVIKIKHLEIKVFNVRHDSGACVGFVISDTTDGKKIGMLTDTGNVTRLIRETLKGCNGYMIEADYDEESLEKYAGYDDFLKERIRGDFGHLSNKQTLTYVQDNLNLDTVDWILFSHLSEHTNSPEILKKQVENKFPERYWNKFHISKDVIEFKV